MVVISCCRMSDYKWVEWTSPDEVVDQHYYITFLSPENLPNSHCAGHWMMLEVEVPRPANSNSAQGLAVLPRERLTTSETPCSNNNR